MNRITTFIRSYPHLVLPAAMLFAIEVATSFTPAYEYFIDELYYIACAKRLAFGYVDHPPLAPFLLRISGTLFGYSVTALRIVPALAGAAVVILTGLMAREMGGKRLAQAFAAITSIASPLLLTFFSFFSVNALEICFWTAALYVLIRMINTGQSRVWLAFGVISGLALLTKHTYVLFGGTVVVALAFSDQRNHLASGQFWQGALVAAALLTPNIVWQIANGFPSLEFYRNAMLYKNIPTPPLEVFLTQIVVMNPIAFPIWALGAWYLLFHTEGKRYRLVGLDLRDPVRRADRVSIQQAGPRSGNLPGRHRRRMHRPRTASAGTAAVVRDRHRVRAARFSARARATGASTSFPSGVGRLRRSDRTLQTDGAWSGQGLGASAAARGQNRLGTLRHRDG